MFVAQTGIVEKIDVFKDEVMKVLVGSSIASERTKYYQEETRSLFWNNPNLLSICKQSKFYSIMNTGSIKDLLKYSYCFVVVPSCKCAGIVIRQSLPKAL